MPIPLNRLTIRYSRSSGPGGQHVNKVETRVEIRFVVDEADWLPAQVRARLKKAVKLTKLGELIMTSDRRRQRHRNLIDCIERLEDLIRRVSAPRKTRVKTRPSRGAKERRLESKRRRSTTKKQRRFTPSD